MLTGKVDNITQASNLYKETIQDVNDRNTTLSQSLTQRDSTIAQQQDRIETLNGTVEKITQAGESFKETVKETNDRNKTLTQALQQKDLTLDQKQDQLEVAKSLHDALARKIALIEKSKHNLETQLETLHEKVELEIAEKKGLTHSQQGRIQELEGRRNTQQTTPPSSTAARGKHRTSLSSTKGDESSKSARYKNQASLSSVTQGDESGNLGKESCSSDYYSTDESVQSEYEPDQRQSDSDEHVHLADDDESKDDKNVAEEPDENTDVESEESEFVVESGDSDDDSVTPEKKRKHKKQTIPKDDIEDFSGRNTAGDDRAQINVHFHPYMHQEQNPLPPYINQQHNVPPSMNSHLSPPKSNIPGFYPQHNPPPTNVPLHNPTPILNPAKSYIEQKILDTDNPMTTTPWRQGRRIC